MDAWSERELGALQWHWSGAYVISHPEPDLWIAQRCDDRQVIRSTDPEGLRDRIIADYSARPVPR